MTKSDTKIETEARSHPLLGQVLFYIGISLGLGGVGGALSVGLKDGISLVLSLVAGTFMILGLIAAFVGIKIGNFDRPTLSTRTGRSQLILLICVFIGAAVGIYMSVTGGYDQIVAGTFAMSPFEAVAALVILFAILLPISIYWHRTIDDFELAAAKDSGYWAIYIYFFGYLGWEIAAAANLTPEVNGFALFLIVIFAFGAIWMAKRSG